jgi:hypothetical protein
MGALTKAGQPVFGSNMVRKLITRSGVPNSICRDLSGSAEYTEFVPFKC